MNLFRSGLVLVAAVSLGSAAFATGAPKPPTPEDQEKVAAAAHDAGKAALAADDLVTARRKFEEAVAIREKLQPPPATLVNSLIGVAATLSVDRPAALKAYERATETAARIAPGTHVEATALIRRADFESDEETGLTHARELCQRAVAIEEKIAPGSLDLARALNALGANEGIAGDYPAAEQHFLQAREILGAKAPGTHELAMVHMKLGGVYQGLSRLDDSEKELRLGIAIEEKVDPQSPSLAPMLVNLGNVAMHRSQFAEARGHYERAMALMEKYDPKGITMGKILANLAELARLRNDLDASEALRLRALAIYEARDPESIPASTSLTGLGNIAMQRDRNDDAEKYFRRALAIREKQAPDSGWVAESLYNLGAVAGKLGRNEEALRYLQRAVPILEREEPGSFIHAAVVARAGTTLAALGRYDAAEEQLRRAIGMLDQIGMVEPDVHDHRSDLAQVLAINDKGKEALALALKSASAVTDTLRQAARTLPEQQALKYRDRTSECLDVAVSIAVSAKPVPGAARLAWDGIVRSRAVVLDELADRHHAVRASGDAEVARLAGQLGAARERLANLVVNGEDEKAIAAARLDRERAEELLAVTSAPFASKRARSRAGLDDVRSALATTDAIVAYVRYQRTELAPTKENPFPAAVPSFAAFVWPAGGKEPVAVPLGPADAIEKSVSELRAHLDEMVLAGGRSDKLMEQKYRGLAGSVRAKVWDPVAVRLGKARRAFLVPDGALNLVSLSALPVGERQYLVETGPVLHYVSAERDLVAREAIPGGQGLLAMGNPAFDDGSVFAALAPVDAAPLFVQTASAAVFRGPSAACDAFRSLHFAPLPAAEKEVAEIASTWRGAATPAPDAKTLTGAAATETQFKAEAPSRRVLHLATHGFVLTDACNGGENPLLRAGLVFTGANRRQAAGPNEDDGVLTAEEIAALDLGGVEWAVLSACETGIGDVKTGEGVLGLRRAFEIAGVRSLVMSLWPVEDDAVRAWMAALYRARFTRGQPTADAVRSADLGMLKRRRSDGKSTHPFYWTGFVSAGAW